MPSRRSKYLDGEISTLKIRQKLEILSGAAFIGAETLPSQTGQTGKFLTTDGTDASWAVLAGGGDMATVTYDPGGISANVYDTDNHINGTTNKVYTAIEQSKLAGLTAGGEPNSVTSVFGRGGAITATTNDYTWAQIDKTTSTLADINLRSHTLLADKGVYTHAQIDTNLSLSVAHIANTSNPHSVNLADVSPLTTKGDIMSHSGTASTRLPVGADTEVLIANSATATGLEWSSAPYSTDNHVDGSTNKVYSSTDKSKLAGITAGATPNSVTSVFGRGGAITAGTNDYTWAQINKTTSSLADITTKSHTALTDKGVYTHSQIDTLLSGSVDHIASTANPHSVDITDVSPLTTGGDIMIHNSITSIRLPVGTASQILVVDSSSANNLAWSSGPYDADNHVDGTINKVYTAVEQTKLAGLGAGPLTTLGDLMVHTGTSVDRLPVGTNGQVLSVDSTTATNLKWIALAGGGDMVASTYDPASVSEQLLGITAVQTMTNKIIDATSNTIINLDTTNLASGVLETALTDDDTKLPSSGGVIDYIASIPINAVLTSTYTLVLSDRGKLVTLTGASAGILTVPANSDVAYAIGTQIEIAGMGAGTITTASTAPDTISSAGGLLALSGQYSSAVLTKVASTEWLLAGDLV